MALIRVTLSFDDPEVEDSVDIVPAYVFHCLAMANPMLMPNVRFRDVLVDAEDRFDETFEYDPQQWREQCTTPSGLLYRWMCSKNPPSGWLPAKGEHLIA